MISKKTSTLLLLKSAMMTKYSKLHNCSDFLGNNLCQFMTVVVVIYQSESVCVYVIFGRYLHEDVIP